VQPSYTEEDYIDTSIEATTHDGAYLTDNGVLVYTLSNSQQVSIKLLAVNGIEIHKASFFQQSGTHQYTLPTSIAPGMYICQVTLGDYPLSIKTMMR
jgi:hypothetical protein